MEELKKLQTLDMNKLNETMRYLNSSADKACKGGVHNLDESYLLKVSLTNIEKVLELFHVYQTETPKLLNQLEKEKSNESSSK